jgi:hypothetical protein
MITINLKYIAIIPFLLFLKWLIQGIYYLTFFGARDGASLIAIFGVTYLLWAIGALGICWLIIKACGKNENNPVT